MSHAHSSSVSSPGTLLGIAVAVAVGAALAVVGVIGTASAVAGDGPGKPTNALVSYDQ